MCIDCEKQKRVSFEEAKTIIDDAIDELSKNPEHISNFGLYAGHEECMRIHVPEYDGPRSIVDILIPTVFEGIYLRKKTQELYCAKYIITNFDEKELVTCLPFVRKVDLNNPEEFSKALNKFKEDTDKWKENLIFL